jgi:hypothetical protein
LLDPDKRAHYDANNPIDTDTDNRSVEPEPTKPQAELTDAPLSPDELSAATLPDPNPWWKSTPEAPTKPEPWWRESAPDALDLLRLLRCGQSRTLLQTAPLRMKLRRGVHRRQVHFETHRGRDCRRCDRCGAFFALNRKKPQTNPALSGR